MKEEVEGGTPVTFVDVNTPYKQRVENPQDVIAVNEAIVSNPVFEGFSDAMLTAEVIAAIWATGSGLSAVGVPKYVETALKWIAAPWFTARQIGKQVTKGTEPFVKEEQRQADAAERQADAAEATQAYWEQYLVMQTGSTEGTTDTSTDEETTDTTVVDETTTTTDETKTPIIPENADIDALKAEVADLRAELAAVKAAQATASGDELAVLQQTIDALNKQISTTEALIAAVLSGAARGGAQGLASSGGGKSDASRSFYRSGAGGGSSPITGSLVDGARKKKKKKKVSRKVDDTRDAMVVRYGS
jgi:hypothetical protein